MKKFFILTLFLLFFAKIPWLFKELNEGFRVGKILVDLPPRSDWELSSSLKEAPFPNQLLNAPEFIYIGRGSQSFVFASKEGDYILKLFRCPPKVHPWRAFLRDLLAHRKHSSQQEKIDALLSGAKLAFEKARDLTRVVYVHLNSTNGVVPTISLKDSLGRVHRMNLGRCRFAIQRRAEPFKEVLLKALQQKDRERIDQLFSSFKELIEERASREILNADPKVSTNFGYLEGRVIEWDFGSYRLAPNLPKKEEVDRFVSSFRHFFLKNSKDETLLPEGTR